MASPRPEFRAPVTELDNQRVVEIGLRMALGADRRSGMRLVLAQGMLPVAIGLAVGLAGAAALTQVMSGLLYNVRPLDPLTFFAVSSALTLVALAATYLPARRAMQSIRWLRCGTND